MYETRNHRIDNVELSHVAAIAEDTLRTDAIELKRRGDQQTEFFVSDQNHSASVKNRDQYYASADELRHQAERIGWKILDRETQ